MKGVLQAFLGLVAMAMLAGCLRAGPAPTPTAEGTTVAVVATPSPSVPPPSPSPSGQPTSLPSTPTVARPTPTLTSPTVAEATPTPLPTPTPTWLPPKPLEAQDFPGTVVTFLNASPTNRQQLPHLLAAWGIPPEGRTIAEADTDDDGEPEILIATVIPRHICAGPSPGMVVIIDEKEGVNYTALFDLGGTFPDLPPQILGVADMNRDGKTEVAFINHQCGAHTCYGHAYIFQCTGAGCRAITEGSIRMAYPTATIEDRDGDGVQELVMYGGTIGSVGAGPQRPRTEIYGWDGTAYRLSETIYDPSPYLYFKIRDANDALQRKEYAQALKLYRQALTDDTLKLWKAEIGTPEMG